MIIKISWRNIWRNKMRSLIIMLSVAIGIFAGIMVLSLYKGMIKSRIKTVIYTETGHLQIHDSSFKKDFEPIYYLKEGSEIVKYLNKMPEVKAIATRTVATGMLSTTTGSAGIKINGINDEEEISVSQLNKKIKEGKTFGNTKQNQIYIGQKIANKMKLKIGSKLVLTCMDTSNQIVSSSFKVTAIYESDNAPFDEMNVYVRQSILNEMLGTGNQFHELSIILKKDESVVSVQEQIKQKYKSYLVESWKKLSAETDLMVNTIDITSYIVIGIILFALAFGIINTMLMAILERTREIGMMMALGMNRRMLFLLVLTETFFLTIMGTPVGLLASWFLANYYGKHGFSWGETEKEMLTRFGFNTTIYTSFPGEKVLMVILFVVVTALFSCIYPSIKALQLKPVDALRK